MNTDTKYRLRTGILVFAGLLFFVVSIYIMGKRQNLFESVISISADFSNVKGLQSGSYVQFSGINVGTVSGIRIINDSLVRVDMTIREDVRKYIHKDAEVEIITEGLMGNNLVTIHPGLNRRALIDEGDILNARKTVTMDELLDRFREVMLTSQAVMEKMNEVAFKINDGTGDLARLLNQDIVSSNLEKVSSKLINISGEIELITRKMNRGNGDMALLLNEDNISSGIDSLLIKIDSIALTSKQISDNLLQASIQLNEGEGIANTLLYDSSLGHELDTILKKIDTGLVQVEEAAETIDNSWLLRLFSKKRNK